MSEEEEKKEANNLVDKLKEYINLNFQLLLLGLTEKVAQLLASLIANGIVILFIALSLLFGSFAGAYALGSWLGSSALGFTIVAGFYLLVGIVLYVVRFKCIKKPLTNTFIKLFLKKSFDVNSSNHE